MEGKVNKEILRHLKENDEWFTCNQLSEILNLNILSVRSSVCRFRENGKISFKKEVVVMPKNSSLVFYCKHKACEPIDLFLNGGCGSKAQ